MHEALESTGDYESYKYFTLLLVRKWHNYSHAKSIPHGNCWFSNIFKFPNIISLFKYCLHIKVICLKIRGLSCWCCVFFYSVGAAQCTCGLSASYLCFAIGFYNIGRFCTQDFWCAFRKHIKAAWSNRSLCNEQVTGMKKYTKLQQNWTTSVWQRPNTKVKNAFSVIKYQQMHLCCAKRKYFGLRNWYCSFTRNDSL